MSDDNQGSGGGLAGGVGAIAVGGGAGYFTNRHLSNSLIDRLHAYMRPKLHPELHQKAAVAALDAASAARKAAIDAGKTAEEATKLADEAAKKAHFEVFGVTGEQIKAAGEHFKGEEYAKKIDEARKAVRESDVAKKAKVQENILTKLRHIPERLAQEVTFIKEGETFTMHVKLSEAALKKIPPEQHAAHGIVDGVVTVKGLKSVPKPIEEAITAAKDGKVVYSGKALKDLGKILHGAGEWVTDAISHVRLELNSALTKAEQGVMKAMTGMSWRFSNLHSGGKAGVIGAAAAGAIVGGYALKSMFGGSGSHAERIESERGSVSEQPQLR